MCFRFSTKQMKINISINFRRTSFLIFVKVRWGSEGRKKKGDGEEETEIAWFNNGPNGKERIVAKDLQDILQHYVEKIANIVYTKEEKEHEEEKNMNGSKENEEK